MPRGRVISVLSLAVWWSKLEKNDEVRHNMTQIASLLVVATVLLGLLSVLSAFCSHRGGGVIAGVYGNCIVECSYQISNHQHLQD